MHPRVGIAACALALAAVACREEAQPSRPPPQPAGGQRARPFTVRDLALATAVDARAARLSVAGADVELAVAAAGAKARARSGELVLALEVARRELDQSIAAVANPLDRTLAEAVGVHASRYVRELSDATRAGAPGAGVALARRDLGDAIGRYRQSRAAWRLDAPEPSGAERELAESRRDLERAESALVSRARVPPRTVETALRRARAAASRLPAPMKEAALRYAAAQEKVLESAAAMSDANEGAIAQAARAYHAAKADALAALASYFAAAASR